MKLGIIGLPNVGKSTLFNALTRAGANVSAYPFCTIDPNHGVTFVPDERLERLGDILHPPKLTPAHIEFVDIAGLVKGASHGEGLGNQFLSHIRGVDAVVHVVRCFEDERVAHVDGTVAPLRDMEVVEAELILSDLEVVQRRLDKVGRMAKGSHSFAEEIGFLERIRDSLERGKGVDLSGISERERGFLQEVQLISAKPTIYVANVDEEQSGSDASGFREIRRHAEKLQRRVISISSKLESELVEVSAEEAMEFLKAMGIEESGLGQVIREGYRLLDLITFYTIVGGREVRAWAIPQGSTAIAAAGKIHSDMAAGFIKAEVIAFDHLDASGSEHAAREAGFWRLEGKEYIVQDGDVLTIRFKV